MKKIKYIDCPECNRKNVELRSNGLCSRCYSKRKEECSVCGNLRGIYTRDENKKSICAVCAAPERPKEICIVCGEIKKVHKRDKNDGAICDKCYKCPKDICIVCGEFKRVLERDDNGNATCGSCYNPPKVMCMVCGDIEPVAKRDDDNNAICKKCYERPKEICIVCNKLRKVKKRNENGMAMCESCWNRIRAATDECFKIKRLLRSRMCDAFKKYSIKGKIMSSKKYGVDFQAIFEYLGPCPGNRGDYHIDHIIPLCSFNFDDPSQVKLAFAPQNHQWLTKEENMKKGSKIL